MTAAAQPAEVNAAGWSHLHIAHHILHRRSAPESKYYAPGAVHCTAPTDDCLPRQMDCLRFEYTDCALCASLSNQHRGQHYDNIAHIDIAALQSFVCRVMKMKSCCCACKSRSKLRPVTSMPAVRFFGISHPAQVVDETAPVESLQTYACNSAMTSAANDQPGINS